MQPNYDTLIESTRCDRDHFLSNPIIAAVLEGRFDRSTYIGFLVQAYHHVKHTVPLLCAARDRLEPDHPLRNALPHYIDEEAGHEEWILDDLEQCGLTRRQARDSTPPLATDAMVAYLYDQVNRRNPAGILGMVLVLEGTSAALATEVALLVKDKLGLPDAGVSYLASHGHLDQQHIRFFEDTVNALSDQQDLQSTIECARMIYYLYGEVYGSLIYPA